MKKVSVIVPMYYEEDVVEECYKRLTKVLKNIENYEYEIIAVNDGSKDKTLEILEKFARRRQQLKNNFFFKKFWTSSSSNSRLAICFWRCSCYN